MDTIGTNQFRFTYSGTKAEFIAAGRPAVADANNLIVFIKDTAHDGAGSCIYAHGMYFADVQSLIAATLAGLAYVKGIKIGTDLYNAAAGGGYIKFEAADPATVAVNVGEDGITIGLTAAFVTKVNDTATSVANIAKDYLTSDDALAIQTAIGNAQAAAVSTVVGTDNDASSANTIKGAKKYTDEKVAEAAGDITTLAGRVTTLEGADAGKSVRGIVQDEVAKQLESENISDSFDTLKEMAEYLSGHPDDVAQMNAAIKANSDAIALLNGDTAGSVNKKIADAIAAEATRADGVAQEKADAALASAKEYADQKTAGLAGNVYTKAEVDAMFAWGSLD